MPRHSVILKTPTGLERRGNHTMKYTALVALVAVAFGLGACAKDTAPAAPAKSVKGFKK